MGNLGEHFPESWRRAAARRQIAAGNVLYLFCHFTTPEKDKFVVVASDGAVPLLLVINSDIRPFVQKKPHLLACQVASLRTRTIFFTTTPTLTAPRLSTS